MKIYFIDTFTDRLFSGSPAAVVVLDKWYPDDVLINISRENAVPESAFIVKSDAGYHIRWFTHKKEIKLCGHVTLAAAYVVSHFLEPGCKNTRFESLAGEISVLCKPDDVYELTLNPFKLEKIDMTEQLYEVVNSHPDEVYIGRDYLLVYNDEQTVKAISPNWNENMDFGGKLISVTAKGDTFDCVTRTFVPHNRMAEEEACGSAHCHVVPYWTEKLNKADLKAYQASSRGGTIYCRLQDGKILMSGGCVLYMTGEVMMTE